MDESSLIELKRNSISFTEEQLEDIETVEDLQELVDSKIITRFKKFWGAQGVDINEIKSLPYTTVIINAEKLSIIPLWVELQSLSNGVSNIQQAYWDQGHLVIKLEDGKAFTIDSSPNGAIITPVETNDTTNVANTTMDDLGTQIKQIIENYTQPNNEDGLDPNTASQLIGFVDRVIKKGRSSEDVSIETKNRIINQIQEALQNTDLEGDINNALTKLKDVCKLN